MRGGVEICGYPLFFVMALYFFVMALYFFVMALCFFVMALCFLLWRCVFFVVHHQSQSITMFLFDARYCFTEIVLLCPTAWRVCTTSHMAQRQSAGMVIQRVHSLCAHCVCLCVQ
jgi:hypothetical protein